MMSVCVESVNDVEASIDIRTEDVLEAEVFDGIMIGFGINLSEINEMTHDF